MFTRTTPLCLILRWSLAASLLSLFAVPSTSALAQDTSPPRITSIAPDPGRGVTDENGLAEIRVGFDEAVVIPASAVTLWTVGGGVIGDATIEFDGATNVLTVTPPSVITQDRVTLACR